MQGAHGKQGDLSVRAMADEQENQLTQRAETAVSHLGAEKYQKTILNTMETQRCQLFYGYSYFNLECL